MSGDLHRRVEEAVEDAALLLASYMRAEGATTGEVGARLDSLLYAPLHELVEHVRHLEYVGARMADRLAADAGGGS